MVIFTFKLFRIQCRRRDSNPHASRRHPLKMVCLPIPPLRLFEQVYCCLVFSPDGAGAASFPGVVGDGVVGAAGVASLFSGGTVGTSAGFGVSAGAGAGAVAGTTDRLPVLVDTIVSASEVTIKITAAAVVAFESTVAAPRWPKAV